jgi:PAS domain S-box-containing protein
MTDQVSVQTAAREPFGCPQEACSADGAVAITPRLWQPFEIDSLRRCWRAAAGRQKSLPPFEELAFASPAVWRKTWRCSKWMPTANWKILTAGRAFEASIGRPARDLNVADLAIDRARALRELHEQAMAEARPVQTVVYGVVDGLVCIYDLVAVPLSNRRELSLCMVYIEERERNFSLVEAMFQATRDGLLALAVIRDAAGVPIDFQIAALNEGAALVMQGTAEGLRGRRLSEVCAEIQATEILPRFVSVFDRGGAAQFELECPLDDQMYLRIGVVTMGDLLAVTLTEISTIKKHEKSFRLLFEANPVPMWVHCTESLKFLAVNDAAIAHYGYRAEAFLAMRLPDIVPQDERNAVEAVIRDNPDARSGSGQLWRHVKADGSHIYVLTSWQDVVFRDQPAQLVAVMDVTEKHLAEKLISYMAQHDALTGLPNRVLFHDRLDEALAHVRRENEKLAIP